MPSRFALDDSDDERLPAGMTHVGYDADAQAYTFCDAADGSFWLGAPGCRYGGHMTRIRSPCSDALACADHQDPDADPDASHRRTAVSWRHELMPLLNFALLIGLCLLFLFWYLHWTAADAESTPLAEPRPAGPCPDPYTSYTIRPGDTCWALAEARQITLDELLAYNPRVDCHDLLIGAQLGVPE